MPVEELARHVCDPNKVQRLYDVHGIYCCRYCDECEAETRAQFRPEIFTDPNYDRCEPLEDD